VNPHGRNYLKGRNFILAAALGNMAVMAASWAWYGWNQLGMEMAARNTARLSSLWFALAFAAPGVSRWYKTLPAARMVQAFVAAHLAHFAAVSVLLFAFSTARISHDPLRVAAIIVLGSALVIATGLTAGAGASFYRAFHSLLLALIFIIFVLALVKDPFLPMRAVVVLLLAGLVLRLTSAFTFYLARRESGT
jgi:hypothetical protein